jgi:hypothetical protein
MGVEGTAIQEVAPGTAVDTLPVRAAQQLEQVVLSLIPSGSPYWELHCRFERDARGCTDIHLHTCIQREEKPKEESGQPHGAYL